MEQEVKLIIADDEPFICSMLEKLIHFDELGLRLVACVHDGEALVNKIEACRPDIVLTDISMPRKDGIEVIRLTREKGIPCHFVIISGYRQFEYAYNALKYNVDDYLLKPVEQNELNRVLKRLCDKLRHTADADHVAEEKRLHTRLIEHGVDEALNRDTLTLQEVNQHYCTHFEGGCFRMFMMRLDFTPDEVQHMGELSSVIQRLERIAHQMLEDFCFDTIASDKKDGVLLLINYPRERENDLKKKLHEIYVEARMSNGYSLTLCVGRSVMSLDRMEETKVSCRRANWMRMHYGINQVIYDDSVEDQKGEDLQDMLNRIGSDLEKAFLADDADAVKKGYRRVFSLPSAQLLSTLCMQFVRNSVIHFCDQFGQVTKEPRNAEKAYDAIVPVLYLQTTFAGYEAALLKMLTQYMGEMSGFVHARKAKPVLMARAYVEQHYGERVTLETMAQIVNLNPIYFSNLFKKETGQNFSEYLTEFRMIKAKEMLRRAELNINQIADALGYEDARYFSKVFKKSVGVKPTDYRKIYG